MTLRRRLDVPSLALLLCGLVCGAGVCWLVAAGRASWLIGLPSVLVVTVDGGHVVQRKAPRE